MSDLELILNQQEGQFFERKSCFDRSQGKVRRRPVRDVARDMAETLAAMAIVDGGALVLGIEDDGAVFGQNYPINRLRILRLAPRTVTRQRVQSSIQLLFICCRLLSPYKDNKRKNRKKHCNFIVL